MIYRSRNSDSDGKPARPETPPHDHRRQLIVAGALIGVVVFIAGQLLDLGELLNVPASPLRALLVTLSVVASSAVVALVLDIRSDRRAEAIRARVEGRLDYIEEMLKRSWYWKVYPDVLEDVAGIESASGGIEPSSGPPARR